MNLLTGGLLVRIQPEEPVFKVQVSSGIGAATLCLKLKEYGADPA
jgi:hypothetical protein